MPNIRVPVPPIPTFVDGKVVSQRALNALPEHVRQLYFYRASGLRTAKPHAIVQATSGTVPFNQFTFIGFGTEVLDTDNMWDPGAPGVVRINTAGVYLIEAHAALQPVASADAGAYFGILIWVNGFNSETDPVAYIRTRLPPNEPVQCTVAVPIQLDEGSIVAFGVVQNASSGQTAQLNTVAAGGCRAGVEWLGPLDTRRGAVAL